MPRGGINSPLRDTFLARFRQEVQGGEPPPCPRVAPSRDRRVAFEKNVVFSIVALATEIFADFPTFFRLTRQELGISYSLSHSGHTVFVCPFVSPKFFLKTAQTWANQA